MRKSALIALGSVALIYLGIAATPLKTAIGRSHPRLAAAFSAPLFNFHAEYSSGNVLDFQVGMNRQQFRERLGRHASTTSLDATCGNEGPPLSVRQSEVRIDSSPESLAVTARDIVCVNYDSHDFLLIFHFKEDRVDRIKLHVVNVELI